MNNTPTPLTDLEIDDLVNGLNQIAEDHLHRSCRAPVLDTIELIKELKLERNKLRKVCDELAKELEWYWEPMPEGTFHPDNPIGQKSIAIELYNQLPHVLERKTK